MTKRQKRKYLIIVLIIIAIFLCLALFLVYRTEIANSVVEYDESVEDQNNSIIEYDESDESLINPLMGYAPSADSEELVVDSSLVYIDITWAELEPEEGMFDFDAIAEENYIEKWRSEGKKAVLRFICDLPDYEEHRDIPEWLYELTGDGEDYDIEYGKGYAPDYNNEIFIQYHEKALKAIGDFFAEMDFVKYVELGSLGHWGEWHVLAESDLPGMPDTETREIYVSHYEESFPYAKLLMRRPFAELPEEAGVFNDMTGAEEDTEEFLDWIEEGGEYTQTGEADGIKAVPDIWESAPVGGEFTSSIPMEDMLSDNIDDTIGLIEDTHMTFIGPKVPEINEDENYLKSWADEILKHLGYRYYVSRFEYGQSGNSIDVNITITNGGVAPVYFEFIPCIYVMEKDKGVIVKRIELDIDLREIAQDESENAGFELDEEFLGDDYEIYAGIEDPATNEPEIYLMMDAERNGKLSRLK
ncbi:MAG: DUF4832 domain-containing protein [Butyrivibrio sp.]|nr:DUF4832 domain-containing protein [Butyrivibrio sp.]